jgi:hypothetical protein
LVVVPPQILIADGTLILRKTTKTVQRPLRTVERLARRADEEADFQILNGSNKRTK